MQAIIIKNYSWPEACMFPSLILMASQCINSVARHLLNLGSSLSYWPLVLLFNVQPVVSIDNHGSGYSGMACMVFQCTHTSSL